jgi:regulator of sigma E protease
MNACVMAAAVGSSGTPLIVLKVVIGLAAVYLGHELGHLLVARCFRVKLARYYFGFDTSANPANFATRPIRQRMIIIAAGSLMNLVMAVACASLAYWLGVSYTPCVIGTTVPGSPAFEANLEPGSRIVQIGRHGTESQHLRFEADLLPRIAMAGTEEDIDLLIQSRDGANKTWVSLRPRNREVGSDTFPTIGIVAAATTTLAGNETLPPVFSHLPAGQAEPSFRAGDRIVGIEIDGQRFSVPDYSHLREVMAQHPEEEMTFVVDVVRMAQFFGR